MLTSGQFSTLVNDKVVFQSILSSNEQLISLTFSLTISPERAGSGVFLSCIIIIYFASRWVSASVFCPPHGCWHTAPPEVFMFHLLVYFFFFFLNQTLSGPWHTKLTKEPVQTEADWSNILLHLTPSVKSCTSTHHKENIWQLPVQCVYVSGHLLSILCLSHKGEKSAPQTSLSFSQYWICCAPPQMLWI